MNNRSIQVGWKWDLVKNNHMWTIPSGDVIQLIYYLKKHSMIYDLGCGLGRHTLLFASYGFKVFASDISEEAVEKTKKLLLQKKFKAEINIGKMTEINQETNFFDLVVAYHVIYHAIKSDIITTISEIYRILKPGGLFFGTFLTKNKDEPFREPNKIIDTQTIITLGGPEDGIPHYFSYCEDVISFLRGFEFLYLKYVEDYPEINKKISLSQQKKTGHFHFLVKKPLL